MGSGKFDAGSYRAFTATTKGKSTNEIYSSRSMNSNLNPNGVKLRESRDSADDPADPPGRPTG